uniref:Uncharacterized protein n=1 Tax=Onchocerca volvulus TaxID=6282 RepID=A0A8R1U3H4_ONCVO
MLRLMISSFGLKPPDGQHKFLQMFHRRLFKTAIDMMPSDTRKIVIHADKAPVGEYLRRFSAPTTDEVAIALYTIPS